MKRITVFIQKKDNEKKKKRPPLPEEDQMEDEMDWPPFQAINLQRNTFDTKALNRQEGINTSPSVFDRQCIFHVKSGS